ncbi:hypothetical protein J4437_05665 [Candidatus Woesearchaeota archaeon]|nr:hypothetical protein [Candidatus Woesearchaeota archaeon]
MKQLTTLVTGALLSLGVCKDYESVPTPADLEETVLQQFESNSSDSNENGKNYTNYDENRSNNEIRNDNAGRSNNENKSNDENDGTSGDDNYLKGPSILNVGQVGYFNLVNKAGLVEQVPEPPESTLDSYDRGKWLVSDGSKVEYLEDKDNNQNTFQIKFNSPGEYKVWSKFEEYSMIIKVLEK